MRRGGAVVVSLQSALLFLGASASATAAGVPPTPTNVELLAAGDNSITVSWSASAGATKYLIYRGTRSGGEGNTPIASTTTLTYRDSHLSSTPVYFYQVAAANASGESARTPEDASKTPPPVSTGGNTAGIRQGSSLLFYCKDARLAGFDWFERLLGWFPENLQSSGSVSPTRMVVDMAYSDRGTLTFNNVKVAAAGLYTIDWRYAFETGLFPGVTNRQMGLSVDGSVFTRTERFPVTGSFDTYEHSFLQVRLKAGVNSEPHRDPWRLQPCEKGWGLCPTTRGTQLS